MKKRIIIVVGGLVAVVIIFLAVRSIREAHYPIRKDPSPEWETRVSAMEAQREAFFVDSHGIQLEAELFVPTGGSEPKAAVVFAPGSGDSLYQNYSGGLVERYVLEEFIERDMAVLLLNKRGMGQSEGSWVKNDFQGRVDDLYAAVQSIQNHASIDADRIGLVGHSQGGWIVSLAAAQHEDLAFFISLVGPVTTVEDNMADNYRGYYRCQGHEGEDLEAQVEKQLNTSRFAAEVGEVIPFGMFGFDAGIITYDPADALQTVRSPGLFVFGENDFLVDAEKNLERFEVIFDGDPPDHLSTALIPKATHGFRVVDDPCLGGEEVLEQPFSDELTTVLDNWLAEQGF